MTKVLECKDLFPGCDFRAEGASEREVLNQAAAHAASAHGVTTLDEATVEKVKGCIREG